ncbi:MAG: hypothetical protein O9345_15645 [Burkholderiaceae bacterium]|jgi:hypothetical protein|nr:hypothetical protein [Burkholderiales bacterium]MCZ8339559.1 hypothetical protein [Burkholderiaceae bacterium]
MTMTAGFPKFRAATAALVAVAAAFALAGCGGDGASNTGGATQTAPGGGTNATTGQIAITVSSAVPTSGNGAVTGTSVVNTLVGGTTRAVVADGTSATTVAHRIRVDYDSVSGVVLAVTHGWGATAGVFEGTSGCVRVASPTVPTLCTGATVDLVGSRVVFTNTLLRGAGTFSSLLNGSITFQAP